MAEENVKSVATENNEPVISQAKARQKGKIRNHYRRSGWS